MRNISATPVHAVRIKTDVGESYSVPDLPAHKSNRVHVSGRPKALRVSATTEAGRDLSSEEIYVTSEGVVFALVSSDGITVDYEL